MITCRRAAFWLSRELDLPLALSTRMILWTHLAVCGKCARFRRHLGIIDASSAKWMRSGAAGAVTGRLRDEVAAEIAHRCRAGDR